jgi:hypothetical protein
MRTFLFISDHLILRDMVKYVYCNHCNAKNDSFNEFCTECGKEVNPSTAASHTIVQDNSSRVAVSGSFDAMYGNGRKKTDDNKSLKTVLSIVFALIFAGVMVFVIYYLWSTNVPDTILP